MIYTAKEPIEDGYRAAVTLSASLPEEAADTTLIFPTVQSCEVGEHAWVQIADEDQDPHSLDSPAPTIAVVAASEQAESGSGNINGTAEEPSSEAADPAPASDQTPLIITSLVVGTVGVIFAIVALVTRRRKKV